MTLLPTGKVLAAGGDGPPGRHTLRALRPQHRSMDVPGLQRCLGPSRAGGPWLMWRAPLGAPRLASLSGAPRAMPKPQPRASESALRGNVLGSIQWPDAGIPPKSCAHWNRITLGVRVPHSRASHFHSCHGLSPKTKRAFDSSRPWLPRVCCRGRACSRARARHGSPSSPSARVRPRSSHWHVQLSSSTHSCLPPVSMAQRPGLQTAALPSGHSIEQPRHGSDAQRAATTEHVDRLDDACGSVVVPDGSFVVEQATSVSRRTTSERIRFFLSQSPAPGRLATPSPAGGGRASSRARSGRPGRGHLRTSPRRPPGQVPSPSPRGALARPRCSARA